MSDGTSENEQEEAESSEQVPSIFDLFEPPPEEKAEGFGPIPVVPDPSGEIESPPIEGWDIPPVDAPGEQDSVEDNEPDSIVAPTSLPDWSAPATGQVPEVLVSETSGEGWADVDGPRWHGQDPQWASEDLQEVFKDVDGVVEKKTVAIDDSQLADSALPPVAGPPQRGDQVEKRAARPRPRVNVAASGERNVPQAIGVGILMAAVALVAIIVKSDIPLLVIITAACGLAVSEIYLKMREIGLHPATLLGITAVVSMPISVYYRGTQAFGLVVALSMIFGALWFLTDTNLPKPALNLGLTLLGVVWVGVLGSFAVLLATAIEDSHNLILVAVVVTVMSDVGAFAGGSLFGRTPFHPVSKGKTWEGTVSGVVLAVIGALVLWTLGIDPIGGDNGSVIHAIAFGLVGGILAPLGDLTESMVKRDLGTKDMGNLIPGHGGVMDRIDGMLFVIPGVYYLALLLDYI